MAGRNLILLCLSSFYFKLKVLSVKQSNLNSIESYHIHVGKRNIKLENHILAQ